MSTEIEKDELNADSALDHPDQAGDDPLEKT
jgi:hypothetical protein